ncbi:MAG: T9SS C-terminal target domain-containing protein [Bacteroidetes bacterium]|nr:MAG: T9SS C-terminal target domain-containing protein [Bacteroidota bacterium]
MKYKKNLLFRKHFFDPKITPGVLMFKILLFCCGFFFVAPFALQSQSFIPLVGENKSWNCAYEEFDWQESYTIRLEGDTLINGIEHKKIIREMHPQTSKEVIGYIREDSLGRVYALNTSFEEGLLYDFSAIPGDTIVLHNTLNMNEWDYDCPWFAELTIVVDTVYTIETEDGITRRVSAVKRTDNNFSELWIEGIGSLAGVLKSGTNLFEELSCPPFLWNYLMCYFEDDLLVYYHSPFDQPHDCRFYDDTSVEKITRNPIQIKILPNPVSGSFFHIESSEPFQGEIYIFNSLGKLVYRESVNSLKTKFIVPIVSFKPGIYFLKLVCKNGKTINANKIIINN